MISPHATLLILAAAVALPACTVAGLRPDVAGICVGALAAFGLAAALDGYLGSRRAAGIQIEAARSLKWFQNRPALLALTASEIPLDLAVEFPEGITAYPFERAETAIKCVPTERGTYLLERAHILILSPWKLWHVRCAKILRTEIRVFPDIGKEPGAKLLLLKKLGGLRSLRTIGRGREFERLREYAPGDSFDEIAWKASARRGRPIVRVFQVERTQDVYAVIDASRLGARGKAVEQFVGAALMLAIAAENNGDNFGLVSFSDKVDHFVAPGRGRQHFSRCREAIFDLQPRPVSPDFAEVFSFLQMRLRRRSLLIFLTDLADPLLAETFARDVHLLSRRHVVLVNRLDDKQARPLFSGEAPETPDEIHLRLAGHMQWSTLKDLERGLQRMGVGTAALTPGAAGLEVVRQYNAIKRRQAI